ncbi:MAG: prepilin-type N-terminal cleavage/methylation domain-containing protein [Bacteroidia bacterium]|nr:prepilin-type N-terminal cleavage/methylation domain-containing protein [Bacteroidia bacterium]
MPNKKLRAFTLAEMLVTLALTSILIMFSYTGVSYIQKLLYEFNEASSFLNNMNEVSMRLQSLFEESEFIEESEDGKYIFYLDSSQSVVNIHEDLMQVNRFNKVEDFPFMISNRRCEYEIIDNNITNKRIVKCLEFDVYFKKQKFHLIFCKNYDAKTKLKLAFDHGSN